MPLLSGEGGRARGSASPGLLRRRYSAPETIMRKYRVAQQRSDSEGMCGGSPVQAAVASPTSACAAPRELMRREALLRRLWGRAPTGSPLCRCCAPLDDCDRPSRSLDGSRFELRSSLRPDYSAPSSPERRRYESNQPGSPALVYYHSGHTSYAKSTPEADRLSVNGSPGELSEGPTSTICEIPRTLDVDVVRTRLRSATPPPPPYELLEIVVSETYHAEPPVESVPAPGSLHCADHQLDIDRYVSDILVESLNSLTDQLESMNATIGDRKISIVEKEIKVRLQNRGVNTVVHLSPTSNNQIIFGNEELYERDACNNPRMAAVTSVGSHDTNLCCESNNNCGPVESRSVLRQIRRLFGEESPPATRGHLSDVDECPTESAVRIGDDDPKRCGGDLPRSAISMEVNTSSDEAGSPCTSLVDSLDDPNSPRGQARCARVLPPRPPPARSAVASLELPPAESVAAPSPPRRVPGRGEVFFVRIEDDAEWDRERENAVVADRMPERIKRRLRRRQRRREMRMECARRGRRGERDEVRGECAAAVDALVDDVVAGIARDECRRVRARRRRGRPPPPVECDRSVPGAGGRGRNSGSPLGEAQLGGGAARRPPRGEVRARRDVRGVRRVYRESEIRDGGECVEILEILECAAASRSSSEAASDESAGAGRCRRSRIPVPVSAPEPAARLAPRVPGGRGSRAPRGDLGPGRAFDVIPEERGGAGGESPPRRASVPGPALARPTRSAATSPPREGEGAAPGTPGALRPVETLRSQGPEGRTASEAPSSVRRDPGGSGGPADPPRRRRRVPRGPAPPRAPHSNPPRRADGRNTRGAAGDGSDGGPTRSTTRGPTPVRPGRSSSTESGGEDALPAPPARRPPPPHRDPGTAPTLPSSEKIRAPIQLTDRSRSVILPDDKPNDGSSSERRRRERSRSPQLNKPKASASPSSARPPRAPPHSSLARKGSHIF